MAKADSLVSDFVDAKEHMCAIKLEFLYCITIRIRQTQLSLTRFEPKTNGNQDFTKYERKPCMYENAGNYRFPGKQFSKIS